MGERWTKWYRMGSWELANPALRVSVTGQGDEDGDVQTDTLHLNAPGNGLEVRVQLRRTALSGPVPILKFVSVCTSDTGFRPASDTARSGAWGRLIDVPRKYQHAYEGGSVWCSPTSCSMILNHYAQQLHRPDLALDVPQVAAKVMDPVYDGTGNWSFNTAFMGSFPGLTSYVTRLRGTQDIERWVEAGIPVTCSVSLDLLKGKENPRPSGHLVVVVGFDDHGDPIINDPDHKPDVRTTYRRDNFERAWLRSNRTVYIAHPTDAPVPTEPGAPWWQGR